MKHIYAKRSYIQFSGDDLKPIDKTGPPDYYIRNGNIIYIFENKDIYINGEIRQSYNFKELEQAFKDKLYYSTVEKEGGSIKVRQKAVLQLTKNIRKILTKANEYDKNYKEQKVRIYPIIVLHDTSFDCPGLNSIVNYWFDIEKEKLRADGLPIDEVRNITIINIDTLILYADFLRLKCTNLNDILNAYIKKSIFKPKKKAQLREEFTEAFTSTFEPFANFIDQFTNSGFLKVEDLLVKTMIKTITSG